MALKNLHLPVSHGHCSGLQVHYIVGPVLCYVPATDTVLSSLAVVATRYCTTTTTTGSNSMLASLDRFEVSTATHQRKNKKLVDLY